MADLTDQTDDDIVTTEDTENVTTDVDDTDAGFTEAMETDTDAPETDAPTDEEKPTETRDSEGAKYERKPKKAKGAERKVRKKDQKSWMEKCLEKKWTCGDMPLWRIYMNSYVDNQKTIEKEDIFKHRRPAVIRKFPRIKSEDELTNLQKCLPLNIFQLQGRTTLPNKLNREEMIRVWKNMRANLPVHVSKSDIEVEPTVIKRDSKKWPNMWPCTTRDLMKELKERQRKSQRKRKDLFPCDQEEEDYSFDDPRKDFAHLKELGHARIPQICPKPTKELLVDRAAGEHPGLVDGDYIVFELPSKAKGLRVYANVCLRGLKGMHLPELGLLRKRQKTWKFCFYPAVIALLAKTQLRYKYAWSANIDYIYDHAWMLFTHIGAINIKDKQRLDDIVVYNYKYSVELELIQESNDVPIVTDVPWNYEEKNLKRKVMLERKELMKVKIEIGSEKITDQQRTPVQRGIKQIEEWFDKLPLRYRNCIFRTTRFSLAFWNDNLFWYLYNPYRCDKFGYWDDDGYACILKFCSKESLKRHLMILLLRAYVYTLPESNIQQPKQETSAAAEESSSIAKETSAVAEESSPIAKETSAVAEESSTIAREASAIAKETSAATVRSSAIPKETSAIAVESSTIAKETSVVAEESVTIAKETSMIEEESADVAKDDEETCYTIQIYNVIYHCCQIHNLKLLERSAPKAAKQLVKGKTIDDCPFDPLDFRDPCTIEQEEGDLKDAIEKPTWLKLYKVTWAKCMPTAPKKKSVKDVPGVGKMRWHQYTVEESNKVFSLWGEIHVTDGMFDRENRGMQTYACYVVCAGMTRIMAPEYWTTKTLDVIVMCGDRYYTHSKLEAEFKSTKNEYSHVNCWNRYLTKNFKIGETMFEAKVQPAICGRLYSKSCRYLWQSLEQMFLKYHFGILTCESSCLGVFKFCGAYYMLDVNSFGPPLFQYGEGSAYLVRATYFYKFMTILILTIGSPECSQYALNPIEILKVIDVGPAGFPGGKVETKGKGKRLAKVECPYDEEKKKQMRKWKHRRAETIRTIDRTCCKGNE